MFKDPAVRKWQAAILKECRKRLGRELTPEETRFITDRGGFIALEMIQDTVTSLEGQALEAYLNSEAADG